MTVPRSAGRIPLPSRRRSWNATLDFRGQPLFVTVGFDDEGIPREVFATGPKEGSDMMHVLSDACVVVSIALQHGVPAEALGKSLGTVPVWTEEGLVDGPASPMGALLRVLVRREWAVE